MPSAIQRWRASANGFAPSRSHTAMKARPATPRNDSMVSTSLPDARTTFARTSEMPSDVAAAMPGPIGRTRREAGELMMA